jgi:hypothetical protein
MTLLCRAVVRRRCWSVVVAVTAVASTVTATAVTPAAAAGSNTITVHAVGDRDPATGAPAPLAGATMAAFEDAALHTKLRECTTDSTGACVIADLAPGTYWVAPVAEPGGGAYDVLDAVTTSINGNAAYADRVVVGEADGETRPFVFRRSNPPMPEHCGARVALVYDLSSSVSADEAAVMKQNSKAFVDALAGTPSSIAIASFATAAPAAGNVDLPLTEVDTAGGVATAKNAIDVLHRTAGNDAYTNWDAALRAAAPAADVVVVFTDGNPTVFGVPPVFPPVETTLDQLEAGVTSANAVKARGTRVIAVGIGDVTDISKPNLRAISGPVESSDYAITTFADLGTVFHRLADELCGGTVVVRKRVIGTNGVSADGWQFTATPDATPSTAVTDASGSAAFRFRDFDAETGTKTVTVAETPVDGSVLDRSRGVNAVCTDRAGADVPTADVSGGVTLELARASVVTCDFVNVAVPAAPAPAPVVVPPRFTG